LLLLPLLSPQAIAALDNGRRRQASCSRACPQETHDTFCFLLCAVGKPTKAFNTAAAAAAFAAAPPPPAQAIAALDKALQANPESLEVLLALGVSHTNELDAGGFKLRTAVAY
jgi:hypothetical protein